MEFAYVPAGQFMMGSENGAADEKPVHKVTIGEGFYMGRYEVTLAQWRAVGDIKVSYLQAECADCPVDNVGWCEVQEFIRRLNARNDGYTYRLPTEAEWEYACRAGTTGDYAGDLNSMAWYLNNSGGKAHPVGQKQPNAWGLYDMHGNVWEWCQSIYMSYPYDDSGGREDLTNCLYIRTMRGGGWNTSARSVRSASRRDEKMPPNVVMSGAGFRLIAFPRK